jgi:hypothetical protein
MADEAPESRDPDRTPHRMVRFDFEPGASPKEIAEAIQRARVNLREEYARAKAEEKKD